MFERIHQHITYAAWQFLWDMFPGPRQILLDFRPYMAEMILIFLPPAHASFNGFLSQACLICVLGSKRKLSEEGKFIYSSQFNI